MTWRERFAMARRAQRLGAATAENLTPPDPSTYGGYGTNTWVVPPSRVTTPERIFLGDDVTILEHAFLSVVAAVPGVTPTLRIGDRTRIGRLAHIACVGEVEIGADVLASERIFIGDTYHGYEDPTKPVIQQPMAAPRAVRIEEGAFLGIGCAVLLGVTVGAHAYVAAGAVVTRDVPDRSLAVGNPARVVRRWDERAARWVDTGPQR
ncbi:MAG: acyltransferase [Acidimicrobiales bacterium]|nr:acyltransferase [Acidimicrobiales bacterium]